MPRTRKQISSAAARKAAQSSRIMRAARGGAPPPPRRVARETVGQARILEITEAHPDHSSAAIAAILNISPGAVRKAWERARLPRRTNKRPPVCASRSETRDDPRP